MNSQSNSQKKSKLIFVCDDDLSILEVIKIMLEEEGYTVETFDDGEHLTERIEEQLPDLILLDYWMAKQDGRQTIYELKDNEKTKCIKILLISAIHNIEEVAQNLNIKFFLEKPFEMDVLISKVSSLISE
jgi:DNA-binding response OmpR family regulator